jgi:hypothetical protein
MMNADGRRCKAKLFAYVQYGNCFRAIGQDTCHKGRCFGYSGDVFGINDFVQKVQRKSERFGAGRKSKYFFKRLWAGLGKHILHRVFL